MEKRVEEEITKMKAEIFETEKLAWLAYGKAKGFTK